jgi:hypothetical protein
MSPKSTQTLYAALVSLVFVLVILRLGRRQKLSFRYAAGWLSLGVLGVIAGVLSPLSEPLARHLHVTPAALLAIGAMILLLVLCVQLSISISGLQEQVRTLAEESAFLRREIDQMRSGD